MKITVLKRGMAIPQKAFNQAFLTVDLWNDYNFITMFYLEYYDVNGHHHDIGNVKIGYLTQTIEKPTYKELPDEFHNLTTEFFSLGDGTEYYENIMKIHPEYIRSDLLSTLNDIPHNREKDFLSYNSEVFRVSLLRSKNPTTITVQYRRILDGFPELTNFDFKFVRDKSAHLPPLSIVFGCTAFSKPSTNIHALIGRNGCGKTTLFNNMVEALVGDCDSSYFMSYFFHKFHRIEKDYFSSLISISFSPFDILNPPPEQTDPLRGLCYRYIGLKKNNSINYNISDNDREHSGEMSFTGSLKSAHAIREELFYALKDCLRNKFKRTLWLNVLSYLDSDYNLSALGVSSLSDINDDTSLNQAINNLVGNLSSGHYMSIFILTKLVAYVEQNTLVLIDEPETHLHPPLLSSLIKVINTVLTASNAVAIIATHSPVVLQEIPKTCVNIMHRNGSSVEISKPEIETYGENVGTLTREVFGLEVAESGFHRSLEESVRSGKSYEDILKSYDGQLGFEAKGILRAMISNRDRSDNK